MSENEEFDYVIVGGGSAGCVLANRLSEKGDATVCLIEAGPPDRSPIIHVPLMVIKAMVDKKITWQFQTSAQDRAEGRRIPIPRGKTLGGSSSVNGMVYIRGNAADYDDWAAEGNAGWGWEDVKPYFLKSEHNEQFGDDPLHGTGGPLNVTFISNPSPTINTFVAAAETVQYRHNPDFNGETQDGFGAHQVTQKNGRRWSAARAYLKPAGNRRNLSVVTNSPVARVIIENGRARGVVLAANGRNGPVGGRIHARREVILSAGAAVSPKILLLSGVGDGGKLRSFGIAPKVNLAGVGLNLQDHASVQTVVSTKSRVPYGLSAEATPWMAWQALYYALSRRGMFSSNMVEAGGFIRTRSGLDRPDIQLVFIPGYRARAPRILAYGHGYSMTTVLLRPKSRGSVGVLSPDPLAPPVIDPRFFEQEEDLEVLLRGYKESRRILQAGPFQAYGPTEVFPGDKVRDDEALRQYIRENSATIFHPVGTCKMGSDDQAVVDDRLRVRGMEGLRVVDGSIMPTIVGGNTNAPIIMIAEKAADMIKQDAMAAV